MSYALAGGTMDTGKHLAAATATASKLLFGTISHLLILLLILDSLHHHHLKQNSVTLVSADWDSWWTYEGISGMSTTVLGLITKRVAHNDH